MEGFAGFDRRPETTGSHGVRRGGGAPSDRRAVSQVLASALLVAAGSGVVVGLGLAAEIAQGNEFGLSGDAVVLCAWLVALYTGLHIVGLGALAGGLMLVGERPGVRVFLAATVGFYTLLNGLLRFSLSIQLFSVTPFMSAVGAIDAIALAVTTAFATAAVLATTPVAAARRAGIAVLVMLALWRFSVWHERPFVRDLGAAMPPLLAQSPPAWIAPSAPRFENAKLVVLGFDGLSWEVLIPLLRRGELPHFRALLEGAAYGQLATLPYTVSPVVWETISTGQAPERTGIGYHQHFEFPGVSDRVRRLPRFASLGNTPMGLRRLLVYTSRIAPWRGVPADATDARVARFWEIASQSGISVGVYGWMNSTPAVPLDGFIHGLGPVDPVDYPEDLQAGLPAIPAPEISDGSEDLIEEYLGYEQALYDRFALLAIREQPELLMFYTHIGDAANHLHWKGDRIHDGLFFSGLLHTDYVPGRVVTKTNRMLDGFLGDVLSRVPKDATIAIVSDHGFGFRGYEHDNAPPGVLILRGPGIRPGVLTGAGVADVTPTLLHTLGLAVADDMDGEVLAIAEPGGRLDRSAIRVASYGPAASRGARSNGNDERELRRHEGYLRRLGYVN